MSVILNERTPKKKRRVWQRKKCHISKEVYDKEDMNEEWKEIKKTKAIANY